MTPPLNVVLSTFWFPGFQALLFPNVSLCFFTLVLFLRETRFRPVSLSFRGFPQADSIGLDYRSRSCQGPVLQGFPPFRALIRPKRLISLLAFPLAGRFKTQSFSDSVFLRFQPGDTLVDCLFFVSTPHHPSGVCPICLGKAHRTPFLWRIWVFRTLNREETSSAESPDSGHPGHQLGWRPGPREAGFIP